MVALQQRSAFKTAGKASQVGTKHIHNRIIQSVLKFYIILYYLLVSTLFRCGLSALSMANDLLRNPDDLSLKSDFARHEEQELDNLLKLAQLRGFSEHGEMYSAENLAELAKEFYGHKCIVLNGGLNDGNFIVSEITGGSAVLVPYDADKNHEPCQQNGHRAHWALVTGQS